jgi:hypothetical protein
MAATLLQTPWLTDTTGSAGLVGRNILDATIPAVGAVSPAVVAAVSWNLSVAANAWAYGYYPGPGDPAEWATYQPQNMARYFTLQYPYVLTGTSANIQTRSDISSLYGQVSLLQQAKSSADVLDLRQIFPDTTLFLQLSPFNIPWANGTSWPAYSTNWGTNPGFGAAPAASTSFTLSMANATQVPNPAILTTVAPPFVAATPPLPLNVFPNNSQGEVAYAELALNVDHSYKLTVTSAAPLPAGATIEVLVDGAIVPPGLPAPQPQGPFLFSASSMAPVSITLTGNPLDYSNPTWHYLRIRLLSPNDPQPDLVVTVSLS